jgi:RND family efflux transporter MFP subunit
MDYVPVYADQARPPVPLPGLAPIALEPAALELAGVQTAAAKTGSLGGSIRTIGTVVADETRVRRVQTKVAGYIEKLYVNFTGDVVRRGQPVLDIYSPELLASEREYLQARHTAAEFAKSSLPDIKAGGEELLRAARRRLELFDVPASQIARLEQTGEAPRVVTLTAPVSGYVTAKDALEGQRIEPGTELFAVADLSRVWVNADLYEYEAPRIRVGQRGTLTLTYEPDAPIDARVAYVYPTLNTATRTLTARFDVDNRNLRLKPGMFANVELAVAQEQGVVFPDSAVMDTGKRQIVFVETAPGHFDPREVRVVGRADGMAQVQAGVAAGDKVVTRANFLLDSESRLRAALRDATAGAGQATGQAP